MFQIMLVIIIPLIIAFPFLTGSNINFVQYLKNPFIAVFCMTIIGLVVQNNSKYFSVFKLKFLKYTGKISYGLYVFHPLCYALINNYFHYNNFLVSLILCFSCAYVVATLSYYFFESNFLKLKRNL